MKKQTTKITWIALILAGVLWVAGCAKKTDQHFGEPFSGVPSVTLAQLVESPDSFRRKPVRIQGSIERQCPAAGCWLFLNDGQGNSIRVELGDYFPELPIHLGGTAEVEGEWIPMGDRHQFIGTRITFSPAEKTP